MTDEKAIDYFKSYINAIDTYGTIDKNCCNNLYEPAKVVLELVEKLKTDLEKAYATIVDQTDKDNEIEYLEDLLKGNLYDGYVYYKDLAREYQEKWIPKDKIREIIKEDLPDDEICETCEIYDVNGVVIKQKLIKVLGEE